ncbi:CPBP family intramembrane metalloprotease [Persephonella atlantica]|uniref:CPBP family intramembrane metalloprotease n=1 Tax=Persephonella atlantica TaxID=2699429 RepID=A0ABS1GEY3_9AQUI|nr:CPBP family intramembrane glutamic endopeptidase [Persephonella atlantica]MBK3331500.1 CPBP family intramembrane metalloprotease [Persephonella atlantica]
MAYITLLLPLLIEPLDKLGFRNIKKGVFYGFILSLPLIVFSKNVFWENVNTIPQVFAEEVFFRGYLQEKLNESLGKEPSIFLTSILFAIPHVIVEPSIISCLTFFPSVIFGYSLYYTKSIATPTILHYSSNTFFLSNKELLSYLL